MVWIADRKTAGGGRGRKAGRKEGRKGMKIRRSVGRQIYMYAQS